jgi:hypothetical protein
MNRRDIIKGIVAACMVYPPLQQVVKSNKVFDETDMFSVFFEEVNGFPINSTQIEMYRLLYANWVSYYKAHRQRGVSTLLRTIARYDSQRGKNVCMVHCNYTLAKHTKNELITNGPGRVDHFVVGHTDAIRGKTYNTILFDEGVQLDEPYHDIKTIKNLYPALAFSGGKLIAVCQTHLMEH